MSDDEDDEDDSVGLPKEKEKRESTHIFATFLASCDLLRICRRILDVVYDISFHGGLQNFDELLLCRYVLSDKAQAHTAHLIATEVEFVPFSTPCLEHLHLTHLQHSADFMEG